MELPELSTQALIGLATVVIAGNAYLTSRRTNRLQIYQMYLSGWHELNRMRIQQPELRALIAAGTWPEDRAGQIALESLAVTYLNILSLSFRASQVGALSKKEFVGDAGDVVRELGFLAPIAKQQLESSAFHPTVRREFLRAFNRQEL